MGKDPAILFYTSDFLTGTMMLSNDQVGKYIRLLCLQHQKGELTEKDMLKICGTYDEDIFSKFEKSGEFFLNKRMLEETEKRKKYSESRASNRKNKNICKTYDKDMMNISKSYVEHMENENENENRNINTIKKSAEKSKRKTNEHLFADSIFYDFEKFEEKFTGTDYEFCDLKVYYEKVKNWSEAGGKKKVDWIATTKNFMLGDKDKGKLVLKNGTQQPAMSHVAKRNAETEYFKQQNAIKYGE